MNNKKSKKNKKLILFLITFLIISTIDVSFSRGDHQSIEEIRIDITDKKDIENIDISERKEIDFSEINRDHIKNDRILIKLKDNIKLKNEEIIESELVKTGFNSFDNLNSEYKVESIKKMFKIKEEMKTMGSTVQGYHKYLRNAGLENVYELNFAQEDIDVISALEKYNSLSDIVEYVEPDYKVSICWDIPPPAPIINLSSLSPLAGFPNDPGFTYQWHMQGAEHGGINVKPAWNITTGEGTVVAIIDTGVGCGGMPISYPPSIPDLDETKFTIGWDFFNDDPDPHDDNFHGTHVAGTIAQTTNNSMGVCGVAFNTSIMPIKALGQYGEGCVSDIVDSIYFATVFGADIISMSLGSPYLSYFLKDAIDFATKMGVTIIAAAGNSGGSEVHYPAAYTNVISVGATQYDKNKTFYSCFGDKLDIVAPGGNTNVDQNNDSYPDGILQQAYYGVPRSWGCGNCPPEDPCPLPTAPPRLQYYYLMGTSMACPHVAGVAALCHSLGCDRGEVRDRLFSTAVDLGIPGRDDLFGHGLVDAYKAVQKPFPSSDPYPPARGAEDIDFNINISVFVDDPDNDLLNVSFYCHVGKSIYGEVVGPFLIGTVNNVTSGTRVSIPWDNLMESARYAWYVVVDDGEDTQNSETFSFQTRSTQGPPYVPSNPSPEDDATNVNPNVFLSFNGGDPGLIEDVTYDLYFGTSEDPLFNTTIGTHNSEHDLISYNIGELENNTKYYWKIIATDSTGNITEGPIWCFTTINLDDLYPTAFFTWSDADAGGPGTIIDFNATYSSDNNGITNYEWDIDGDGIYDKTGITVTHDFYDCENYTVVLRVTDTIGQMDTYKEIVHASSLPDDNPFPFYMWVDADGLGPESVINFDASSSFDDNSIISYEWDFDNDSVFDDTGIAVNHDFGDYENHTVVLRVTDTIGQSNISMCIVKASGSSDNTAPTIPTLIFPSNNSINNSINTALKWISEDNDYDDTVSYDIYLSKTNPPVIVESNYSLTSYSPDNALEYNQTYYWKIVAKDSFGGVTNGSVWSFTTGEFPDDAPPHVFFTWSDVDGDGPGSVVNFDASSSFDDNGIVLFEWDFDNDSVFDDTGEMVSFDFDDYENYTVVLLVTDTIGQNNSYSCTVKPVVDYEPVTDTPPNAFFTWSDADGDGSGSVINFDASSSSDDNEISVYEWDFNGDGIYDDTGIAVNHDYGDYNVHTVTLHVNDTIGQNDTYSSIVQAGFVENISISFEKPLENMLYISNREICSFPFTLVIGRLDVKVNITVPEGIDVSKICFFVDNEEIENTSFIADKTNYSFEIRTKAFSLKTLKIALYNNDEEITNEAMEVLIFKFLKS